jgi:hypothetical protein
MSTFGIFMQTLPYVFLRLVAYLLFGLLALIVTGIMAGLGIGAAAVFGQAGGAVFVILLIALGVLWGLKRLAERYVLYLIKAGHVAVITELVQKGALPAGVNQVSYGKEKVLKHFASTSVLFGVDALVAGSVRQILRWLVRLGSFLNFLPGAKFILGFVYRVLRLAGNYIDEAVLSYILLHEDQNVWRAAADGVVLYAQGWKKILWRAVGVVLVVMIGWLVIFLVSFFALLPLASLAGKDKPGLPLFLGFVALVAAWLIANVVRWALVDPFATVAMIVAYNEAVREQTPSYDLYSTLAGVSRKFRELEQKARQAPVPGAAPA